MNHELTILVLDDEPPIREGICNLITQKLPTARIVAQGSNGIEGLSLYHEKKPNLIISDIVMPLMTGLQLLKEIRKTDQLTSFIVVSGYDEFSYAREAIRLGATDYLLKPVTSAELIQAIIKATEVAQPIQNADYEELRASAITLFLQRLLNGEVGDPVSIKRACASFEIPLSEGEITILTLATPHAEELTEVKKWSASRNVVATQHGPHLVLFIQGTANRLHHTIEAIDSLGLENLRIGVGQTLPTLASAHISFESSLQALTYQAYYPQTRIFTQDMIDRSTPALDPTDIDTLQLKELLLLGEEKTVITWFNSFFTSLFYIKTPPLSYLKGMCIFLLTTIHKQLGEDLGIPKTYFEKVAPFNISATNSVDELQNHVQSHLLVVMRDVITQAIADNDAIIHQAKQYVENHLDEIISASEVSDSLNMSPTYFSTYFKHKTGQTFRAYAQARRNEYSKQLLANFMMSIEEISEQLGYTDYRSFHRIFKQMNGITPSEYRKRITKR